MTIAVVGIGQLGAQAVDAVRRGHRARADPAPAEGVCAEVAGVFLTADGRVLQTALNDRMIGISGAQLRNVDELIAIPYEVPKAPAVRAALLSGMVDTLVTHVSLAEVLLADPDQPPAEPRRDDADKLAEIPLHGGTANRGLVVRRGDTVRRPLRPTSAATHALLNHLEEVGFDGAPRLLGIDAQDREVLTYHPRRGGHPALPGVVADRRRAAQRRPAAAPLPRGRRRLRRSRRDQWT